MRTLFQSVAAILPLLACGAIRGSEIREFPVPVLERLGNELSHRDSIAARAADVVLEEHPSVRGLKMRGWITDLGNSEDKVYLIAETAAGPWLAYTVTFHGAVKPLVEDRRGEALPQNIAVRYKARNTAIATLKGKLFDLNYNFEVLDDPDGQGFLVYALGVSSKPDEVVLAGHFRVTVSANGGKAERVDALSRSKYILPKKTDEVAAWILQFVSDKPVETFIYVSNLHHIPIYVGTPDRMIWNVADGKMKVIRDKKDAPAATNR